MAAKPVPLWVPQIDMSRICRTAASAAEARIEESVILVLAHFSPDITWADFTDFGALVHGWRREYIPCAAAADRSKLFQFSGYSHS